MVNYQSVGTLFPDGDEYPDHESVPSSFPPVNLPSKRAVAPVAVALAVYGLCPAHDPPEHVPHHDAVDPAHHAPALSAIGSTSATPFIPSRTHANDEAIRQHYALRDAQMRMAGMSSTNSAWF